NLRYYSHSVFLVITHIGQLLLQLPLSYLKPLVSLIVDPSILALANFPGGGLTDNTPRVLPDGLDAKIKLGSWPVPPLFRFLFEKGNIEREEMLRVFNMGIGMVMMVGADSIDRVTKYFAQIGQRYFFIVYIVKGWGGVTYDAPPAGFASWIE